MAPPKPLSTTIALYQICDRSGIDVFTRQYGPRRTFYAGLTQKLQAGANKVHKHAERLPCRGGDPRTRLSRGESGRRAASSEAEQRAPAARVWESVLGP